MLRETKTPAGGIGFAPAPAKGGTRFRANRVYAETRAAEVARRTARVPFDMRATPARGQLQNALARGNKFSAEPPFALARRANPLEFQSQRRFQKNFSSHEKDACFLIRFRLYCTASAPTRAVHDLPKPGGDTKQQTQKENKT